MTESKKEQRFAFKKGMRFNDFVASKKFGTLIVIIPLFFLSDAVYGLMNRSADGSQFSVSEAKTVRTCSMHGHTAELKEQTHCPMMGGAINKNIFVKYQGKKVYFCCPGCEDSFNKEPEKYMHKLPQFQNNSEQYEIKHRVELKGVNYE